MADEETIVVPEAPADEAFVPEEQPAPEEPFQPRSVYDRIREAQRLIARESFVKDKKVELRGGGGYSIIPIAQILDAVRRAHARAGIITVFQRPEYDAEAGEFRRADYALGHVDVKIIGDGPDDMLEVRVPCEAKDPSDKLTNKLLTNAMRCLYRTLYSIDASEMDDPELFNEPLNETKPMSREEKAEAAKADPFFGKKNEEKSPRQLAEDIEAWASDDTYKSSIKAYKSKNKVMSAYDLPEDELRKLHDLLVSKGAGQ